MQVATTISTTGQAPTRRERAFALTEAYDLLGRRVRLLLAEDDDEVRWSLTALFLNGGYDVRAVRNGAELLEHLTAVILGRGAEVEPDVIVTDVRMPGFSALDIVTGLRDAGWTTPVMVISAFGSNGLRERVQGLGDSQFFDKPLDLHSLEVAVSKAADRCRSGGGRRRPPGKH